jgi:hypothetical protein
MAAVSTTLCTELSRLSRAPKTLTGYAYRGDRSHEPGNRLMPSGSTAASSRQTTGVLRGPSARPDAGQRRYSGEFIRWWSSATTCGGGRLAAMSRSSAKRSRSTIGFTMVVSVAPAGFRERRS